MIGRLPLVLPDLQIALEGFGDIPEPTDEMVETALRRGAQLVGEYVQQVWTQHAQQKGIQDTGAYLRGIAAEGRVEVQTEGAEGAEGGALLNITVTVTNTAPHAAVIEDGHGAFSLPARINWSGPSVKQGKHGPYLVIPMRHAAYVAPGQRAAAGVSRGALRSMMPQSVHHRAMLGQVAQPSVTGSRPPIAGRVVQMGVHDPALKVVERDAPRMVGRDASGRALVNPAWKSGLYEGLRQTGRPGHSQFHTFRVVKPDSEGWNIPALAGYHVARDVAAMIGASPHTSRLLLQGIRDAFHLGPA